MHVDVSKPINSDYFSKLDDEILEKCTAFTREVSQLDVGKKYLFNSGQENPYWKHLGQYEFSPCVKALSHCGLVFRGDSREPKSIFKDGFKSKDNPNIKCDNDFFEAVLNSRLASERTGLGHMEGLGIRKENVVCCTKNIDVATYFPNVEDSSATYVYCCYVNAGIKVFNTVKGLENPYLENRGSISTKEVLTPIIPPEHVIYGWKVSRKKLESLFGVKFKTEYQEIMRNENIDSCVYKYLEFFPFPESDRSSKFITVHHNGVFDIENA